MASAEEIDPNLIQFFWHWHMFPLLDLMGPALVYSVGLQALGYPPTWADTKAEADAVDAAIIKHLNGEKINVTEF